MSKLNPPILEGIIPSFFQVEVENEPIVTTPITIPFIMNRSVSLEDVEGIMVKFKTIGGVDLGIYEVKDGVNNDVITEDEIRIYNIPVPISSLFNIGQYYKIQLAYVQNETHDIGYYSSVGVAKYTAQPLVGVTEPEDGSMIYGGLYEVNPLDKTEKWYSYQFDLVEYEDGSLIGTVIDTTGLQLHTNIEKDYELYEILKQLDETKSYKIVFTATSVNKHVFRVETDVEFTALPDFPESCTIVVSSDYDNGYFDISVDTESTSTNNFILWRYSTKDDWCKLQQEFKLTDTYRDFTIEHGVQYTYALQGEEQDILVPNSKKLLSSPHTAKFEDMFLGDKNRQLKIKFNPKINGYKQVLLESKTDTIGGKYPVFTRNASVGYKEVDFGGLISYLTDEQDLFHVFNHEVDGYRSSTNASGNTTGINSTALTDENINKERIFREVVYEWLVNGEPKYLRSSTEGNHIVRLMNPSLSPNDTVGRMLYTFSTSSFEIGDNTRPNLIKYNIVEEV